MDVTFHIRNTKDIVLGITVLRAMLDADNGVDAEPIEAVNTAESHPISAGDNEKSVAGPSATMTVDQLKSGMTLKETATATLGDGTKVSADDYVTFNGETWLVCVTYRGSIIAQNEDGKADVLKTENCTAAVREPEPQSNVQAGPRAGTAAALLGPEATGQAAPLADVTAKVDPATAGALRELATAKVSGEKTTVEKVFAKLESLGAKSIDGLTVGDAMKFKEWIEAEGEEPPAADPKFGF